MADERVSSIQQLWADGDYPAVGAGFAPAANHLAATLPLADRRVLDAATGTGNFAIAAAKAGAHVDAFDLTDSLLKVARERAAAAGVSVRFTHGDLVDVPYADNQFDEVVSTFGAFLADDPVRCVAELLRVTRPGGHVTTTAWASDSMFIAMRRAMHDVSPDLVPDPSAGPFAALDELIALTAAAGVGNVVATVDKAPMWIPFASGEAAIDFYADASGPIRRFRAAATDRQWTELRERCATEWEAAGRTSANGIEISAVYTIARLTKPAG